uniref:Large ribosomal subunit protein uL22c n=1 Tax=Mallomonas splendens TaxID=52552 RepID=A0A3G2QZK3_9STRA|nr:ribosomal protein L22 [Mallomonas splendens]AYO28578.1 ribosomal protein L22 [Mallomonas splendens]
MTKLMKTVSASSKYIRISPNKINVIIMKIRGKSYKEALQILKYLPQRAGAIVWQTLYSAVSNAIHNYNFQKENLIIQEAYVNQGPILKRMRPRARGRGFAIEKKISHLTIRVCEI